MHQERKLREDQKRGHIRNSSLFRYLATRCLCWRIVTLAVFRSVVYHEIFLWCTELRHSEVLVDLSFVSEMWKSDLQQLKPLSSVWEINAKNSVVCHISITNPPCKPTLAVLLKATILSRSEFCRTATWYLNLCGAKNFW